MKKRVFKSKCVDCLKRVTGNSSSFLIRENEIKFGEGHHEECHGIKAQLSYLRLARKTLQKSKQKFMSRRPKKWYATIIFFLLGLLFLHPIIQSIISPDFYDNDRSLRTRFFLEDIFGPRTRMSKDLLTQDIFLTSYEIGKREPYFFSQTMTEKYPIKYDVNASDMLRATFQYPGVNFNEKPLSFIDTFDFVESSSWLSYLHTKYIRKEQKKVKFLSLIPGEKVSHQSEVQRQMYNELSKQDRLVYRRHDTLDFYKYQMQDASVQQYMLKRDLGIDYLSIEPNKDTNSISFAVAQNVVKRFKYQVKSLKYGMSKEEQQIRDSGYDMYHQNKKEIESFIRAILDDRYGRRKKTEDE